MQVVAGIKRSAELLGIVRVSRSGVEVNHGIESVSTVFRNVPYLRAIEVSPFVFFLASRISVASAGAEPCEAARPSV